MKVCKKLTKFYHDQIVKKSKGTIFIISIDRRRKTRRNKFDLVKKNEEFEMNTRDTPKEIVISRGKLGGRLLFRRGSLPEFQEASSPTRRKLICPLTKSFDSLEVQLSRQTRQRFFEKQPVTFQLSTFLLDRTMTVNVSTSIIFITTYPGDILIQSWIYRLSASSIILIAFSPKFFTKFSFNRGLPTVIKRPHQGGHQRMVIEIPLEGWTS